MNYHQFFIRKPSGGFRRINAPDEELKAYSLELLFLLEEELQRINWWSKSGQHIYSYRKGYSCKTLAEDICCFTKDTLLYDLYSMDIKDYFGSITRDMYNDSVAALYNQGCNLPLSFWDKVWDASCIGPGKIKSIAQGNPLSPIISNIVGWVFVDMPMVNGLLPDIISQTAYYRYSDNIFIVAKRRDGYSRASVMDRIGKFLCGRITDHLMFKVDVRSNRQENTVLGIRLGMRPQLKNKKWLRSVFYRVHTRGPSMLKDKDILKEFGRMSYPKLIETVQGLSAYAISIDPSMERYILDNKPMETIGVSHGNK
jgi:hypothetical protein